MHLIGGIFSLRLREKLLIYRQSVSSVFVPSRLYFAAGDSASSTGDKIGKGDSFSFKRNSY
jgi:hypothetical protein